MANKQAVNVIRRLLTLMYSYEDLVKTCQLRELKELYKQAAEILDHAIRVIEEEFGITRYDI